MQKFTTKKGFTLVELLVVISIIGVLSSVVLSSIQQARIKSRDAQRAQEIRSLKIALHLYFNDQSGGNGTYLLQGGGSNDTSYDIITALTGLVPTYMPKLPIDPKYPTDSTYRYNYIRGSATDSYGIGVYNEKNSAICKTGVNMTTTWWSSAPTCPF